MRLTFSRSLGGNLSRSFTLRLSLLGLVLLLFFLLLLLRLSLLLLAEQSTEDASPLTRLGAALAVVLLSSSLLLGLLLGVLAGVLSLILGLLLLGLFLLGLLVLGRLLGDLSRLGYTGLAPDQQPQQKTYSASRAQPCSPRRR